VGNMQDFNTNPLSFLDGPEQTAGSTLNSLKQMFGLTHAEASPSKVKDMPYEQLLLNFEQNR